MRKNPKERKEEILNAAIDLAIKKGYKSITKKSIADSINISHGLITRYFNTMDLLKKTIVKTAIKKEILPILAQGLILKDSEILKLKKEIKEKIIESLT